MRRRRGLSAAALVAVAALCASCQPAGPVDPGTPAVPPSVAPSPAPSPTHSAPPSATVEAPTTPIDVGAHRVDAPAGTRAETHEDGTVALTVPVPGAGTLGFLLDAPAEVVSGRLAGDGIWLTRPVAVTARGSRNAPFEKAPSGEGFAVTPPEGATGLTLLAGTALVVDSRWESSTRVLVFPTLLARSLATADPIAAAALAPDVMAEVVAAHPDRGDLLSTPSAMNQLACHLVGAPDKESWNLETDRPDKGLVGFMVDRCN